MNIVCKGLVGLELFLYMDDVVIFSKDLDTHIEQIQNFFNRLREANLRLQSEKCQFLSTEIGYLGHIISADGVKPDDKKVESVRKFPIPKNVTNVRQFLGLAGYYRRFIKDFSLIAEPLIKLLKKEEAFIWGPEQQNSFEILKETLCIAPILQFPNFELDFILTTDASDVAIGAVLSQGKLGEDLPIAYFSKKLLRLETKHSTTEKECLAVVYATLHFRPYLYGREFILVSDHEPLKWIDSVKPPLTRLSRWRTRLREYQYRFIYKP